MLKKLKLTIFFLLFSVFAAASFAQDNSKNKVFGSDGEFGAWTTYYYLNPEPAKVAAGIKYYSDSTLLQNKETRVIMLAFFSAILKNNPLLTQQVFDDIASGGSKSAKIMLLNILWMQGSTAARELIKKAESSPQFEPCVNIIQQMKKAAPPDILLDPVEDAASLDMLWAFFFATGDSAAVKKIISVLHLEKDGHGLDIVVGGAAGWSLQSNAIQHKKVLAICKEELKTSEGLTREILEKIVRQTQASGPSVTRE